jgi:hypothetical protein
MECIFFQRNDMFFYVHKKPPVSLEMIQVVGMYLLKDVYILAL